MNSVSQQVIPSGLHFSLLPPEHRECNVTERDVVGHDRDAPGTREDGAVKRAVMSAEKVSGKATHLLALNGTAFTVPMSNRMRMEPAEHQLLLATKLDRISNSRPGFSRKGK